MDNKLFKRKKNALIIPLVIVMLALLSLILLINIMIISDNQVAAIFRLGKPTRIIYQPGIYLKIPFVENSYVISKKLSETTSQPVLVTTTDRRDIYIEAYALWQMNDPNMFIYTRRGKQPAEIIDNVLATMIPKVAKGFDYQSIKDGTDVKYSKVELELKKVISALALEYGIVIKDVFIKSINLSSTGEQAVISKMNFDCEKTATQIISEGTLEAKKITSEADNKADIITKKAEYEVSSARALADKEAAVIYARSYSKDVEFYKFIKSLLLLKDNLTTDSTIVFPSDSPIARYLMKP